MDIQEYTYPVKIMFLLASNDKRCERICAILPMPKKRPSSQQIAMIPARAIQPREVIEIYLLSVEVESQSGIKYSLLVVDETSRFPFAYPLPSKQGKGVSRQLLKLYLTLGIPIMVIRSDRKDEFDAR